MITPTPSISGSLGSVCPCPLGNLPSPPAPSSSTHPSPPGTITKFYRYLFSSSDPAPIFSVSLKVSCSGYPCGAVVHFSPPLLLIPFLSSVVAIDWDDPLQLLHCPPLRRRSHQHWLFSLSPRPLGLLCPFCFRHGCALPLSCCASYRLLITPITRFALPMLSFFTPCSNTSASTSTTPPLPLWFLALLWSTPSLVFLPAPSRSSICTKSLPSGSPHPHCPPPPPSLSL